ncbi:hypothetical protein HCG51_08460 [Tolypothrix sp. PCC 7910]|uniref:hypothetical protein n=1 Tax=Tolypothrix sp. PCC 7910 TaxID=2099387 RepID=UPI0014277DCD|nr:hypothetical protein [Tolypothrix sp. PCC 7910]QIR36774.1 hypothetical protein HCG51_08460 [Tolypothrix sp. PCC 7910]
MKNTVLKSITTITLLAAITPFSNLVNAQSIKPQTNYEIASNKSYELTMDISFDEGDAYITVPDNDVTLRHIGRLRRYDLHIAKMFEVSAFMCDEGMVSPGIDWHYYAGGGNIDMGTFRISCKLANDIVNAYKVRRPEPTAIKFSMGEEHSPEVRNYRIGILDIERDSNKTIRWLKFVQKFKPIKK